MSEATYKCIHCDETSPAVDWLEDGLVCPKCGCADVAPPYLAFPLEARPGTVMIADDDAKLLRECLAWAIDRGELDDNQQRWHDAFMSMLDRWRPLTPAQRSYVKGIHERLELSDPTYTNEWSAGKITRGASLATPVPEVLLRPLPKRPPGRL